MSQGRHGSESSTTERDLFGGAVKAQVPPEFTDVSSLRQIPDNQEVFAHADTDRSLLFELLQSEEDIPASGALPARFHWGVLVRDSGAFEDAIMHEEEVPVERLAPALAAGDPAVKASIVSGTHRVAKFRDTEERANVVLVSMACIRLPRASTDVLIVFNDPIAIHDESSSAREGATVDRPHVRDLKQRSAVFQNAVSTFRVVDWSLFG